MSNLCRELDINRSQFNRYLNGEAYPRPDVLFKICQHFGTDARILHVPIETLIAEQKEHLSEELNFKPFLDRMRGFEHRKMPDGYYRFVRPSPIYPGKVVVSLIVLKTNSDGTKNIAAAIPRYSALGGMVERTWRERRIFGLVFQHIDGVSFFLAASPGSIIQLCYFAPSFGLVGVVFSGYTAFTQRQKPRQAQVIPALLEYSGAEFKDGLRVRRSCGQMDYSEITDFEREFFDSWEPFGPFAERLNRVKRA